MIVYRIGSTQFIDDLTGEGAFLFGGRWNRPGVRVLYTAQSISLAAWELFVHINPATPPLRNNLSRISIDVPDNSVYVQTKKPSDWPNQSEEYWPYTDSWLLKRQHLCMQVPSAVISGELNYLINPEHGDFGQVRIIEKAPFSFDPRSFEKPRLR